MIKDLSDSHLFNNYPCESEDVKIEALREQMALLRDKINKYLPECDHYSDNGVKFYTELLEALAATEPK